MSVEIGKAWEPRPGAPPRGAQDAWLGPNRPPGKQKQTSQQTDKQTNKQIKR